MTTSTQNVPNTYVDVRLSADCNPMSKSELVGHGDCTKCVPGKLCPEGHTMDKNILKENKWRKGSVLRFESDILAIIKHMGKTIPGYVDKSVDLDKMPNGIMHSITTPLVSQASGPQAPSQTLSTPPVVNNVVPSSPPPPPIDYPALVKSLMTLTGAQDPAALEAKVRALIDSETKHSTEMTASADRIQTLESDNNMKTTTIQTLNTIINTRDLELRNLKASEVSLKAEKDKEFNEFKSAHDDINNKLLQLQYSHAKLLTTLDAETKVAINAINAIAAAAANAR